MALYCNGIDCNVKENCYRYTMGKEKTEGGFYNGVWFIDKRECNKDKKFYYVKIKE